MGGFWEGPTSGPVPEARSAAKGGAEVCACQALTESSQHQHPLQRIIAFNTITLETKT